MLKNKIWLGIILSIFLLVFSINGFTAYYKYTQESGANFYVGIADKADALEDTNEMRQIIDDLGNLLGHSKKNDLYPKDQTTGGYLGRLNCGLDASKPAVPVVNDMYLATDTVKVYRCFVAGNWVQIYPDADKQPLDAQLTDVAGLTPTDSFFIVGDGINFITESGATARASLGLTIGTDVQAYSANNAFRTDKLSIFAATTSAELAGVISDETGTGKVVYDTSPNITTPTGIVKGDVGLGNVENLKVKLDGIAAPTVNDDNTLGYAVGSRWIDVTNDKEYVALDVSTGAAVWTETTGAGGGASTFTGLTDTPANYTGSSLKFARVNVGETALEFATESDPNVDTDAEIKAILVDEVTKTGTFTAGKISKINNATGIIEEGTNTDTDVADAVTKKHSQNTDTTLVLTNVLASDHTYSGLTDSQPVGESVVFGDLLYFNWTDKEWKKTDADVAATMPGLRIALETKADGETCLMLVKGYIRDDSAFEFAGSMVYTSVTPGAMSSTAPTETGDQVQRVGVAKSADILFFDPSIDVGEI